ncbi:MAG: hypothetical protein ACLUE1_01740 [Adlercreutzia equolifaciens]
MRSHSKHIYHKLGVHSKARGARLARSWRLRCRPASVPPAATVRPFLRQRFGFACILNELGKRPYHPFRS